MAAEPELNTVEPKRNIVEPAATRSWKAKATPGARRCEKHPENSKFYGNGQCAACSREKARARYQETKPMPRHGRTAAVKPNGQAAGVEQKKCQSCKQMRSINDYDKGAKRAKRRCKFCEAGSVQTKVCSVCNQPKPVDEFDGKSAVRPLGRAECKDCRHRANGHADKPLRRRKTRTSGAGRAAQENVPVEAEELAEPDEDLNEPENLDDLTDTESGDETAAGSDFGDTYKKIRKSADAKAAIRDADEFEYSKPLKCSKCAAFPARYRRRKAADLSKDYWICMNGGCQVKIAHVFVKVDRSYAPPPAAAVEAAS